MQEEVTAKAVHSARRTDVSVLILEDSNRTKQVWQYGSGRCTLKTAHRKFSIKRAMQTANDAGDTLRRKVRKRHQISMIRKSFYITVQRLLLLHSRTVIENSPNSKSKDENMSFNSYAECSLR